jgi:hypothetical protein
MGFFYHLSVQKAIVTGGVITAFLKINSNDAHLRKTGVICDCKEIAFCSFTYGSQQSRGAQTGSKGRR